MIWEKKSLSELCIFAIDCVNKTAPVVDYETPYKMIRTTNVKGGFIDLDSVRYVDEKTFIKWTRRSKPQYGDVILTREAPVGSVGRFTSDDENVFLGQRLFHYRPNPKLLDWNYLAYVLQSEVIQSWLHGIAFGATVPHIKVEDAENLEIPYPPIEIQIKIGKTLSAYDDLIENNLERIKLLEEMAQITYEEWFVRFKFPNYEQAQFDSETGLPEDWELTTIGNICELTGGGTPSRAKSEYWDDGNIVWFSPTDLSKSNSYCLLDSSQKITEEGLKKSSAKQMSPNSFMMTSRATIGLFGLINKPYTTNQGFINITPKETYHKLYLFYNFMNRVDEFKSHATGATFLELSKSNFKKLKIIKPSEQILEDFNSIVSPISITMMKLTRQNQLLKEAHETLLPRLMIGEIDINNVELPQALIDRIATNNN